MDANIALVNAINSCSERDQKDTVTHLREAFSNSPRIILDPRFGYTIYRLFRVTSEVPTRSYGR